MPCHPYAVLDVVTSIRQSDGTYEEFRLSLLDGRDGIWLMDWDLGVLNYKGGGTFVNSPLAEGTVPVQTVWDDVTETFTLGISGEIQNSTIKSFRALGERIVEAVLYWTSYSEQMVWLEAKTAYETETRYAVIKMWSMPGHNNPFANPFTNIRHDEAALGNVPLTITHLPWQHTEPGTGECVETSGLGTREGTSYLEFTLGDDDNVNCGSDASLDDLPDNAVAGKGQITVEAWIRANSYGQGNVGTIATKTTPPAVSGFVFTVRNDGGPFGGGLQASIGCTGRAAISSTGTLLFNADGEWHYVLFTYDETGAGTPAARTIYLNIDGAWVGVYENQVTSIGNYATDAAADFIIGNEPTLTSDFDGDIAWVRVHSDIVYDPAGGNFTPEPRCAIPPVLTNTELLVIYEGTGATTSDLSGNGNDGTITGADWANDCDTTVGRTATCDDEVFTINKHNKAQITHAFVYDASAGTYSANLIGSATPFNLFPAVPAVGDRLYIGVETSLDDTGPFNNVVFDTGTAQNDLTMINGWRYWDGAAWTPVSAGYDGTETVSAGLLFLQPFTNTGVRSLHYRQVSGWATVAVNGVTGYWIMIEISLVGAAPSPPTQQNRDIYTITWNDIDIEADQVNGDIESLVRIKLRGRSGDPSQTLQDQAVRTWIGLRTTRRGPLFVPWLNASDEQNQDNITFAVDGAVTTLASDTVAPTGRYALYNPAGASSLGTRRCWWIIDSSIAWQYFGRFSVFVRVKRSGGSDGDFTLRARCGQAANLWTTDNLTKVGVVHTTAQFETIQLGVLSIPTTSNLIREEMSDVYISLEIANSEAGTPGDLNIYDMFLLPVDQWTGFFYDPIDESVTTFNSPGQNTDISYLDIDDIGSPKHFVRAMTRHNEYSPLEDENAAILPWGHIGIDRAYLIQNQQQRLFFYSEVWNYGASVYTAYPQIGYSVTIESISRYLSMRGDS